MARQPTFIHLSRRHWQADYATGWSERIVRKKQVTEKSKVILYTRPGCHLCKEMKEEILAADCAEFYTLEEIDIETDPALLQRYRNDIPVLSIDGVETFKHRVRPEEFSARLIGSGGKPTFPT
jgi:hypothetical protein